MNEADLLWHVDVVLLLCTKASIEDSVVFKLAVSYFML